MPFTDLGFIFAYLPVVLVVFLLLGRLGWRHLAALWLGLASLYFYGFESQARLLPIIMSSIVFNYAMGRVLAKWQTKWLLAAAVGGNLAYLGYFKYANFFLENMATLLGGSSPALQVALPIGISFFTFTQIAFLVDVYQGKAREYKPHHYLLFVTFFPHLVAGPILHHKEMMPQFEKRETYRFNPANFTMGLAWFTAGLFKKRALADNIGEYANVLFKVAHDGGYIGTVDAWLGAIAYTLQLYFDFSGYSDMAIGLALMMGIWLPLNFNSPYKAASLIEFWRRWHMTLSRFLRDYLYIPLGGNRKGKARRYMNLMITMLLGGFWHGAAWNFIVWGGIHGFGLCINHAWQRISQITGIRIPSAVGVMLTFVVVVVAWVPFRAENMHDTIAIWHAMFFKVGAAAFNINHMGPPVLLWVPALLAMAWFLPNTQQLFAGGARLHFAVNWRWAIAVGAALGFSIGLIVSGGNTQFLYFKF